MSHQSLTPEEYFRHQRTVLQELFNGQITAETAAPRLIAANLEHEGVTFVDMETLWHLTLNTLESTPDRVQTVADLVICMSNLSPPLTESGQAIDVETHQSACKDLAVLGLGLNNHLQLPADDPEHQIASQRFEAANAAIAKLTSHEQQKFGDTDIFSLWNLQAALESPLSHLSESEYDDHGDQDDFGEYFNHDNYNFLASMS